MPVGEAMDRITSAEFAEWIAYDRISPIGELRADLRSAMLLTLLTNALSDEKAKAARVEDFVLEDLLTSAPPAAAEEQDGVEVWQALMVQYDAPQAEG